MSFTCDIWCDVDVVLAPPARHLVPVVNWQRVQVPSCPEAGEGGLAIEEEAVMEKIVVVVVVVEETIASVGPPHVGGLGHTRVGGKK